MGGGGDNGLVGATRETAERAYGSVRLQSARIAGWPCFGGASLNPLGPPHRSMDRWECERELTDHTDWVRSLVVVKHAHSSSGDRLSAPRDVREGGRGGA